MSSDLGQPIQQSPSPRKVLNLKTLLSMAIILIGGVVIGLWVWRLVWGIGQSDILMTQMDEVGTQWLEHLQQGRWAEVHARCTAELKREMPAEAWQKLIEKHPGLKSKMWVRGFNFSGGGPPLFTFNRGPTSGTHVVFHWESDKSIQPPLRLDATLVVEEGQARVAKVKVNDQTVKP